MKCCCTYEMVTFSHDWSVENRQALISDIHTASGHIQLFPSLLFEGN